MSVFVGPKRGGPLNVASGNEVDPRLNVARLNEVIVLVA
jgi:hypothetical protein